MKTSQFPINKSQGCTAPRLPESGQQAETQYLQACCCCGLCQIERQFSLHWKKQTNSCSRGRDRFNLSIFAQMKLWIGCWLAANKRRSFCTQRSIYYKKQGTVFKHGLLSKYLKPLVFTGTSKFLRDFDTKFMVNKFLTIKVTSAEPLSNSDYLSFFIF